MRKSSSFLSAKLVSFLFFVTCLGAHSTPKGFNTVCKSGYHLAIPHGCTVITVAKGDKVFFGGNDDYINLDSYCWVDPGQGERYGVVWIGYPDNVQQGVNEHGLAYDANGLPRIDVNPHNERKAVSGDYTIYPIRIMRECQSVKEVIEWVNTHQWHSFMHDQMHFADASGDAVIISAGKDGEIAFTKKEVGDAFLVSTNFNVANPANAYGYPCWRYDLANEMLEDIMAAPGKLCLDDMVSVMDAVHQEGINGWTKETMIADLKEGLVYLYYFYQFDKPVVIDIKNDLENPREAGELSKLFPDEVVAEANVRYNELQNRGQACTIIGMVWIALVLLSLLILFIFPPHGHKKKAAWVFFTLVLGPLSIVVLFVSGRKDTDKTWKLALLETMGDLVALVFSLLLFMLAMSAGFHYSMPWFLQVIFILGGPLLFGWILIPTIFISQRNNEKLIYYIFHRLPHAIISINLGLAGILAVAMLLISYSIQVCIIMPISLWTIGTWWSIFVAGAVCSALLFLFLYEYLSVKAGYHSWSESESGGRPSSLRPWSKSWLWILVSIAILLMGITAGVLSQ